MNKKLQQKLFKKYPSLFRDRKNKASRMSDGIDCGDGWYHLIDKVSNQLNKISGLTGSGIKFLQIKEKFAVLTIYYDVGYLFDEDIIHSIIRSLLYAATTESMYTCEKCSDLKKKTSRKLNGRIYGYCNSCFEKVKKENQNK